MEAVLDLPDVGDGLGELVLRRVVVVDDVVEREDDFAACWDDTGDVLPRIRLVKAPVDLLASYCESLRPADFGSPLTGKEDGLGDVGRVNGVDAKVGATVSEAESPPTCKETSYPRRCCQQRQMTTYRYL